MKQLKLQKITIYKRNRTQKGCIRFDFIYLKADQWLPWAQGEGSLLIAKVLKVSFKSDGNVLYIDLSDVYTPVYWIYSPKLIEKKTYN